MTVCPTHIYISFLSSVYKSLTRQGGEFDTIFFKGCRFASGSAMSLAAFWLWVIYFSLDDTYMRIWVIYKTDVAHTLLFEHAIIAISLVASFYVALQNRIDVVTKMTRRRAKRRDVVLKRKKRKNQKPQLRQQQLHKRINKMKKLLQSFPFPFQWRRKRKRWKNQSK